MKADRIVLNEERNVSLTAYIQDVGNEYGFSKRPAMIVIPGGGYTSLAAGEGDPVAMAYLRAGYHAFVLRYTLRDKGVWPAPMEDYEQAYEYIESHSEEWGVDMQHVAIVGFSAGGHLAACIATMSKCRPQAALLIYPGILPELMNSCAFALPYPSAHVDGNTCPCFIAATRTDEAVSSLNELDFERALVEHGILYESHMYSFGPHGFSTAEPWIQEEVCPRVPRWVDDSISWLSEVMGKLTRTGFTEPLYPGRINTDSDEHLSVYCTFGHLKKQGEPVDDILKPICLRLDLFADQLHFAKDILQVVISGATLQSLMKKLGFSEDEINNANQKLSAIKNQTFLV